MKRALTLLSLALIAISCKKPKEDTLIQGKVENEQIAIVSKIPGKILTSSTHYLIASISNSITLPRTT